MSAYLVASVQIKDPQKWKTYTLGAKQLLDEVGGKLLAFDPQPQALVGEFAHMAQVLLEFPDPETLDTWFTSDAYQQLIPSRDAGADVLFVAVREFVENQPLPDQVGAN